LTVLDLFLAGSETTGYTMSYFFLFVTLNPKVQKKIQREIDDAVPKGLTPTLQDIDK
jgi:cytochrome P450